MFVLQLQTISLRIKEFHRIGGYIEGGVASTKVKCGTGFVLPA